MDQEVQAWGDVEIENLCKDICSQLSDNLEKERNNSIDLLRKLCSTSECSCINLTPCQQLESLLSLDCSDHIDYTVCLSIITNYDNLINEQMCQRALEKTLMWSFNDSSDIKYNFLSQLWLYKGLSHFKIEVLEEFICKESKYVEDDITQLFEEVITKRVKPDCLWEEDRFARIVFWSSSSAKIFCAVISVMNSWIIRVASTTSQYIPCINVVTTFIAKIKQRCKQDKKDFVLLYPMEYHSLVTFLDIDPDLIPRQTQNKCSMSQTTVKELIRQNLDRSYLQTLCILTHFPKWAAIV